MRHSRTILLASLMTGASALALPAFAQTTNAATQASPDGQLGEIVVTAQRVTTSAQTTPISMSVYTPQELQQAGVHDIGSLVRIDPSVKLTTSNGAGYVAIRGIASTDLTEIGDPAVPIARDGFFTNRSYSIFNSMYDLQRIEVLKGPQGTLFGRNSTGGLINIITQRPTDRFEGYASTEFGDYRMANFEGAVNVPVDDKIQFRLSGTSRYHAGYRDNIIQHGDDENDRSVRGQVQVKPVDGLTGLLSVQYDHQIGAGPVEEKGPYQTVDNNLNPDTFLVPTLAENHLDETRYRWEIAYSKLPLGATLTYLGGYDTADWRHRLDSTGLTLNPLNQFIQQEGPHTQNHEVRLASPTDQRFTWQVGYFYFHENNNLTSGLLEESGPSNGKYEILFQYNVLTSSHAFFGQAAYKLTDELKLSFGARSTTDHKVRTGNARLDLGVATGGFLSGIVNTPGNGETDENKPTFHVGLDYTPTSRNLLYAKYDSGYKSGGFNSNGSAPSVSYGPETVDAFEVGSKNRFMDNRIQANIALFYQNYEGYQASQFTPALGGGPGVQNAGNAKIYGAEGELIALVDQLGQISVNATLLHARFTKFLAVNATGTATVDLADNALPNAPDFTLTAALEHNWDVGSGKVTGRIDGKYQSKSYFSFYNFEDTALPEYAMGNVSLMYTAPGGRWSLQGYVHNFTNKTILSDATENSNALANTYEFAAPRTVGVRAQVNW